MLHNDRDVPRRVRGTRDGNFRVADYGECRSGIPVKGDSRGAGETGTGDGHFSAARDRTFRRRQV